MADRVESPGSPLRRRPGRVVVAAAGLAGSAAAVLYAAWATRLTVSHPIFGTGHHPRVLVFFGLFLLAFVVALALLYAWIRALAWCWKQMTR